MAQIKNKSSMGRMPRTRSRLMATAVSACFTASAYALPTGPSGGTSASAGIDQVGNVLTVTTNVNRAVLNWNTFSIGANETTRFIQPSVSSSVLNRVLSSDPSVILGTLTSNGKVFLINPNGIMVGAGARIDVGGFVASTLNITDANFLANKLQFDATPGAGSVVNQGSITTPSGGTVYLVAPNVTNEGIITTPQGETILAAGQTVALLDTGTPGVSVEITGAEGNATNLGQIVADAGRIGIAGVLVRNSGTLNASSVVVDGGRVFLTASQDAYVDGDGRIVTTGTKGGSVEVLGNRVAVMDNASIDASGDNGGGTVLIGGDYQGKNPNIQNASMTYVGANTTIKADAKIKGNGGKVIVWSNEITHALGSISAIGGIHGGNGGFVETSGKNTLEFTGLRVDTRAPMGETGTLLLDPSSLAFSDASWGSYTAGMSTNLVLQTSSGGTGDITFTGSGASNSFAYGLSILAYGGGSSTGNIGFNNFNLNVTGNVVMTAGWDGGSTLAPTGIANKGNITLTGSTVTSNGTMNVAAGGTLTVQASTSAAAELSSNGDQTISAHQINVLADLTNTLNHSAYIASELGNQNITVGAGNSGGGGIQLTGGGGNGNCAHIESYGSQYITVFGGSTSSVVLQAGNGAGGYNSATIESTGNSQVIDFHYGGSLMITGGSVGSNNYAEIHIDDNGQGPVNQYVGSYGGSSAFDPIITLTGGASGGGSDDGNNDASISIKETLSSGDQTIQAAAVTMTGGAAAYGGAGFGAAHQSIYIDHDLTMTGGSSNSTSLDGTPGSPVYIGNKDDANVYLQVGGNVTINGGTGTGGTALIGSLFGYGDVRVFADGDITINANKGGVAIGSMSTSTGGYVSLEGYGNITVNDSPTASVLIGSNGTSGYAYLTASGNITLGTAGGLGVNVGNTTGSGGGYVRIKAGIDDGYSSDSGGNIILNGSAHIKTGNIGMYASSGYYSGANGNITQNAGSSISAIGTIGVYADSNITLNGSVTTPNSLYGYSGIQNAYNGAYESLGYNYGMGDKYTQSQFGGNIAIGGNITAAHVELVANRGWDSTYGGATGNVTQATGSIVDITAVTSLNIHAAGNIDWNGTTNFIGSGGDVNIYSGYDTGGDSTVAGKYVSIGTINDTGGYAYISATGAILDGNGAALNITARNIDLFSQDGGASNGLAISMDTTATDSLNAYVSSDATYGGISIRNQGVQPTNYVDISDWSTNGGGITFTNTSDLQTSGLAFGEYGGGAGNIVVATVGPGSNMIVNGGYFTAGPNGTIVLAAANNMDLNSSPNFSAYGGGLPDLALIAGGTMNVNTNIGYGSYGGYALNNLVVGAGTLNVGGTYSYGRLSAENSVTVGTTGDITLSNGSWITTDFDSSGGVNIKSANGTLSLNNDGGIGGGSGVIIKANKVKLDNSSWIETGDGSPAPDIKVTVNGGDLTLNNGSYISAGNDVFLKLTGASSKVTLDNHSYILSDSSTLIAGTTHINFTGRASGGVFIDGVQTTTTVYGGSGFFAVVPSTPDNNLDITYASTSNPASNFIDQIFNNLTNTTNNTLSDYKKKKGDDTSNEGNHNNEHHNGNVGQCT